MLPRVFNQNLINLGLVIETSFIFVSKFAKTNPTVPLSSIKLVSFLLGW